MKHPKHDQSIPFSPEFDSLVSRRESVDNYVVMGANIELPIIAYFEA
jgi:hypothetical protein